MNRTDKGRPDRIDPEWAWARYCPGADRPWTLALAGHLYRRAAFGGDWTQLQQALSDGPQKAVDDLMAPRARVEAFHQRYQAYDAHAAAGGSADNLRAWWLRRILETPQPLLEKMTLFWHGYFGISNLTVKNARLMGRHVQRLRSEALGSFRSLLKGTWRDPAVLLCVDGATNRRAAPNPNLAKVLLHDYTVGPGEYGDRDVSEAARAFTGWFVLRGKLRYFPREHDGGPKHVLGRSGNFGGDDVVELLLDRPATSRRVVRRLYRWFVAETHRPRDELLGPLAESFARDHDVGRVVETMLRSNLFFSPVAFRQRVKCPVEFGVGIVRGLEGMVSTTQLAHDLAAMGQNLYHPPTTAGWPDGRRWINPATAAARQNLAGALVRGSDPYGKPLDPEAVAARHGRAKADAAARFVAELFLQDGAANRRAAGPSGTAGDLRAIVYHAVTRPQFHLA